jgi:phosphohistidine phosphatase
MDFYLVRHGEAVSEGPDSQRGLTLSGRQDVARVAQAAGARNIFIAEIVHSGKLRAKETAEILAEYLSPLNGVREISGLAPDDDPMIGKTELGAATNPLMVVGHLPYIRRLAGLLVTGDPERHVIDFAPATLACCNRENSLWKISWVLMP